MDFLYTLLIFIQCFLTFGASNETTSNETDGGLLNDHRPKYFYPAVPVIISTGEIPTTEKSPIIKSQKRAVSNPESLCIAGTGCNNNAEKQSDSSFVDICKLPLDPGSGNTFEHRWYYNSDQNQCSSFWYKGHGGNDNNFQEVDQCRKTCLAYEGDDLQHEKLNMCTNGDPLIDKSTGDTIHCDVETPCPLDFWCHYGASDATTVCCASGGDDPCTLDPVIGHGPAEIDRFFYDRFDNLCKKLKYSGLAGNENNFLNEESCSDKCVIDLQNVMMKVCNLQSHDPASEFIIFCQNSKSCPYGYFCSGIQRLETAVCCPVASNDVCLLSKSEGIIDQNDQYALKRWYFDVKSKSCRPFVFYGKLGNKNNFKNAEDCSRKCRAHNPRNLTSALKIRDDKQNPCPVGRPYKTSRNRLYHCSADNTNSLCPPLFWCHVGQDFRSTVCCPGTYDPCQLPVSIGSGTASLTRWYFNAMNKKCEKFTYSGMKGNQNNFMNEPECQEVCRESENPCYEGVPLTKLYGKVVQCDMEKNICPAKHFCHVGEIKSHSVCCPSTDSNDICQKPAETGNGGAKLRRWHYDQNQNSCISFVYSGLGGNENNFLTLYSCLSKCQNL